MFSYTPSATGWAILCRPGLMLAVDLRSDDKRLGDLWDLTAAGPSPAAILDALSASGISKTPPFALAVVSASGAALTVRGTIARVETAGVEDAVSGIDASSWTERNFAKFTAIHIDFGAKPGTTALPINDGIARASRLSIAGSVKGEPLAPLPAAEVPLTVEVEEATALPVQTITSLETRVLADDPEVEHDDAVAAPAVQGGYDHLFGQTVMRSVEDAAVREDESDAAPIEDATIVAADLASFRAQRRAARSAAQPAAIVQSYALQLSTGHREPLEHSAVVGRAPTATRVGGNSVPRLITLTNEQQDVSRSHVQLTVEGGTVVITDLHSRNGTIVTLPNRPPQKLRAGEPTAVIAGTVVDLGGGATLTVVEL